MILLIAAVPLETEALRRELAPCEVRRHGVLTVFRGTLAGQAVALLHSGVGKASAAAASALALALLRPQAVISFGCAGAYPGSGLEIGDLVLADEECYGDEGTQTPQGFLDLRQLGLPAVEIDGQRWFDRFPVDGELLTRAHRQLSAALASGRRVGTGPLVTVSTCSGTMALGEEVAKRTGGVAENMEGAAVAQQCAVAGTPFLEVRGISNLVEDRDPRRWDLKGAATVAQQAVRLLLGGWSVGEEPA